MARIRSDYEHSVAAKLIHIITGDADPLDYIPENDDDSDAEMTERRVKQAERDAHLSPERLTGTVEYRLYKHLYRIVSVAVCLTLIIALLVTTACLPRVGSAENPHNNEVSRRYIESGLEETGAMNIVSGMILDYRAFDTFGESCVLFAATICVFILLKGTETDEDKRLRLSVPDDGDEILRTIATLSVPLIFLFGIYTVLNGHLSAGGGFSGGAVIGSGLVLYVCAFGFKKTERFFTEKTFKLIVCLSLTFYCLAKSYSFFTGANGLESGISLGEPGAILSSGLILPLNICVGLIVACTIYAFYVMFSKSDF